MDLPSKHPWLWRRPDVATWYLRAKVPADLKGVFPSAEVKVSLKTRDVKEASRRIHVEAAKVQQRFDAYRNRGETLPSPSSIVRHAKRFIPRYSGIGRPPTDLTSSEELPEHRVQSMLANYWNKRQEWISEPVIQLEDEDRKERADLFEVDAAQLASGDQQVFNIMFGLTTAILEEAGYYFDSAGMKATRLGELVLRAEVEALRQRASRLRGDPHPETRDKLFVQVSERSDFSPRHERASYSDDDRDLLFELQSWLRFLSNRGMKPRQLQQYERDLRSFAAGLKVVGNFKSAELQKFYEKVLSSYAPNTVIRKFSVIRSYWRYLKIHQLISSDLKPFEGLLLPTKKAVMTRRAWTPSQICSFWHTARSRSDEPLAQAIRIAAFTGSRIEAICSLSIDDVFTASDGKLAFHFSDKTDAGVRDVPVHSALQPMILAMLAAAPNNGGFLLKAKTANQYDDRSAGVGKRFSRLKMKQDFGGGFDFHSIRRTVVGL